MSVSFKQFNDFIEGQDLDEGSLIDTTKNILSLFTGKSEEEKKAIKAKLLAAKNKIKSKDAATIAKNAALDKSLTAFANTRKPASIATQTTNSRSSDRNAEQEWRSSMGEAQVQYFVCISAKNKNGKTYDQQVAGPFNSQGEAQGKVNKAAQQYVKSSDKMISVNQDANTPIKPAVTTPSAQLAKSTQPIRPTGTVAPTATMGESTYFKQRLANSR